MRYLEQGIKHVVNWILGPGEDMLNGKQQVGYDIVSAEEYKRNHEAFELQCRVIYLFLYLIYEIRRNNKNKHFNINFKTYEYFIHISFYDLKRFTYHSIYFYFLSTHLDLICILIILDFIALKIHKIYNTKLLN